VQDVSTRAVPVTAERSIDNDTQAGPLASGPVGNQAPTKVAMGSLTDSANSSYKPSEPSTHFTATSGPAAIAAISAFDFGGVAAPHRISAGAGAGVSKASKLCRSGNGSGAPVTKTADAKRAPGCRRRC
jgi:hypothetical protein